MFRNSGAKWDRYSSQDLHLHSGLLVRQEDAVGIRGREREVLHHSR